jgi:hypothetical protein
MPKILGAEYCAGVGSGTVSRGALAGGYPQVLQANAGGASWWSGRVIYQHDTPSGSFLEADGHEQIDPKGASRLDAGGQVWAARLEGDGYRDSLGRTDAGWNVGGVGPDGTVGVIDYASGRGLTLLAPGGKAVVPDAYPDRQIVQVLGAGVAAWTENGNQTIRSVGIDARLEFLTHVGFWLRVVRFRGGWWLAYQDEHDRTLFHEAGRSTGYILAMGNAFGLDVSSDGFAVYSISEGEAPGDIRTVRIADLPIVELAVRDGGNTGGGNGGHEPGGGTGGGRMRLVPITQADFAGAEIINGPQGIKGWAEVGNVTLVRFTGGQMLCDFSFRRVLPPVFPGGGVPQQPEKRPASTDIGPRDPIRFCDVLFCKTDDGRTRGIVFARDHHDDEAPFEATKDISHWAADVFRRTPLEGVDYREGDSVGIAFFAGSPYRTRDDEPEAVGTKHWRTNMAIVQISTNKEYSWAPMPLPEGGDSGGGSGDGGHTGGGGDTGGTDAALAARVGVHDQQIGDILRFIDGPGGIREYMKAHAGSGQTVDLGPLTERVAALEQTDKQAAHKGDRVTTVAKLPIYGNVALHGTIDKE